jgi:hypothetical protein
MAGAPAGADPVADRVAGQRASDPDDQGVFGAIWKALKPERDTDVRLMVVDNTLHLSRLWVSEKLVGELEEREGVEVLGELFPLRFDAEGRMELE